MSPNVSTDDVYILGVSMTKFGRYPDKDVIALGAHIGEVQRTGIKHVCRQCDIAAEAEDKIRGPQSTIFIPIDDEICQAIVLPGPDLDETRTIVCRGEWRSLGQRKRRVVQFPPENQRPIKAEQESVALRRIEVRYQAERVLVKVWADGDFKKIRTSAPGDGAAGTAASCGDLNVVCTCSALDPIPVRTDQIVAVATSQDISAGRSVVVPTKKKVVPHSALENVVPHPGSQFIVTGLAVKPVGRSNVIA